MDRMGSVAARKGQLYTSTRALLDALILVLIDLAISLKFWRLLLNAVRRWPSGHRRWPRVAVPRTADEKFLWRKIFDHDPRFVTLSDKLACKSWVASLDLGVDTASVRWTGQEAAEIPPDLLAQNVVVKANHGCAMNLFPLRDGLSREQVVTQANGLLQQDHGVVEHQWAYFAIDRQLFVEDAVGDESAPVVELKAYTFGRLVPRVILIADRFGMPQATRWEPGPGGEIRRAEERGPVTQAQYEGPQPATFPLALALAKKIGEPFDHMRVDFMTDGRSLWLGEVTVYNMSGWFFLDGYDPDSPFARAWDLKRAWFLGTRHANPLLRLYAAALRRKLAREQDQDMPASL